MAKSRKKKKADLVPQEAADAPLDSAALLQFAQPVLVELTKDLLERADGSEAITSALKARHAEEKKNNLTADGYPVWRRNVVVQIAAGWLLSCVFVRTLEDRGLLDQNRIAGPGAMGAQHTFFQLAPYLTERDYLLATFRELEHFPATKALFDREHNLAWRLAPSAEASKKLLELFRTPNAETPAFRFGQGDTRFLGDLYQDLSEEVRKRYALLQTPDFIEAFILDRTLEPAIEEFGLEETTLIDPTCGSGHFLLGAFDRLFGRWVERGKRDEEAVELAMEQVYGVDVNPYAVSIARFRLTLAGLEKLGVERLAVAPALKVNLAVADSLLHNYNKPQKDLAEQEGQSDVVWRGDEFALSDAREAREVLDRSFAAVVGNPPYITVKDKALRDRYRELYEGAYREYALSVPFVERFFELARPGGFQGSIVADSFAQREFGKKLIEQVLPNLDLSLIIDCSGVELPGHGSTTVILFGRNQRPSSENVIKVGGLRQDPDAASDPANGRAWVSIREHWSDLGYENEYISVERANRKKLSEHPWTLAGGGAGQFKALLEERSDETLKDACSSIGFMCITKQDDVFSQPDGVLERHRVEKPFVRTFIIGENVRDWTSRPKSSVLFPYKNDGSVISMERGSGAHQFLWRYRAILESRAVFGGKTFKQAGRCWYEYGQIPSDRIKGSAITFAFVVSHNHFVLDPGGKVFNRSAPIIKFHQDSTEQEQLALLAYLNSSTACFWMKQVCYNKGSAEGILPERNEHRIDLRVARGTTGGGGNYEFAGKALSRCPLPPQWRDSRLSELGRRAQQLGAKSSSVRVTDLLEVGEDPSSARAAWSKLQRECEVELVAIQEEIDWEVYSLFSLTDMRCDSAPYPIRPGARPFEIALARKYGDGSTAVYGNDGYVLEYAPPDDLPASQQSVWNRRMESLAAVKLLESPAAKRRWRPRNLVELIDEQCDAEIYREIEESWTEVSLRSLNEIWERISQNEGMDALSWHRAKGAQTRDWLAELIKSQSMPYNSLLQLRDAGLEKQEAWEQTWILQRKEDAGERADPIAVPPKFVPKDFRVATYWPLRGKLNVPKERFISYPGCESDKDGEPIYGWAGWDHAQRAKALAALYVDRKESEGWTPDRLQPMLAGLLELLPWIKQWHPEPDPDTGEPFGTFLETYLEGECHQHGFTYDDLRAWRPLKKSRAKKKSSPKNPKKRAKKDAAKAET